MTNSEPLGRNQAMKQILGISNDDEFFQIVGSLMQMRSQIGRLSVEQLKSIKQSANELLFRINKELMNGPADSRVSDIMPRRTTQGAPDSTD